MRRRLVALTLFLGLSAAITTVVLERRTADDRIGQICVVPAPTGHRDQRLDAEAEIYVYVYFSGDHDDYVSSSSFSRVPEVEFLGPSHWRVVGAFASAVRDRPRTPDCNGGVAVATLGHLASGSYSVESTLGELSFRLPNPESRICVSRP